jgi:hypothetical protein
MRNFYKTTDTIIGYSNIIARISNLSRNSIETGREFLSSLFHLLFNIGQPYYSLRTEMEIEGYYSIGPYNPRDVFEQRMDKLNRGW